LYRYNRRRAAPMNLLLLEPADLAPDGTARLTGRRLRHALEVLRAAEGDVLRVGLLGGLVGMAEVLRAGEQEIVLRPSFEEPPPERPGVDLLLAIPRPKALRKVLPAVASLGVDRVVLVNAARVEKSYFDSSVLRSDSMRELLIVGLEQARTRGCPRCWSASGSARSSRTSSTRSGRGPDASSRIPAGRGTRAAVGSDGDRDRPEGGWVPFEIELLRSRGFVPFTLGPRTLRVEVAVPYALGAIRAR